MGTAPNKEIKQAMGHATPGELADVMPDNIDELLDAGKPTSSPNKKPRKPRGQKTTSVQAAPDPFLNDPRYQAACARMACFGGKGMIERGFDAGAKVLDDEAFKLDQKESLIWDDFFYVLSKKPLFDVGRPIFLVLFFFITLIAQLGWRVVERSESDFIMGLFAAKPHEDEEKKEKKP